jgi:hypothetical protein
MMGCKQAALLVAGVIWAMSLALVAGQDDASDSAARLKQMTPEQKDDLRRKKIRFDELSAEEKQQIRDLHASITNDPNAKELSETLRLYNRWLANLDPADRSTLLDIKDPQQRIARIKELMQQQEERRFRQYFANLPEEDRKTIFKWLGEFVASHTEAIRDRLPPPDKQRLADAPNEEARRRELFGIWQRRRRELGLPFPGPDDYDRLFKDFSAETQKTIESSAANALSAESEDKRTPERQVAIQHEKVAELVRTALYSRFFPQISQEELLKYYAAMKTDDPRRKQLEGKEGEELRRELQRMYNWEHGGGRGGPPGPGSRGFGPPPGGPGFGPPPGGRGAKQD